MAKEKEGLHGGENVIEHVGYTARDLRAKIHTPFRATQITGPTGAMLERVQNGGWSEHLAILGELFDSKDLDEVFTHPKAASAILENVVIFQAIKGIPEIAAKGAELTAEDVSKINEGRTGK